MSAWDPFELAGLPLSAYTPGQGDPKMEGGYETANGAPLYTFEQYLRGDAPYVTGATSRKNPTGQLVYRNIGGQNVPVRIDDYGPKVQGIDIASSNKEWATKFPYQGATDTFTPPNVIDSGRPVPINQGILAQFAVRNYAPPAGGPAGSSVSGAATAPGRFDFINDYYKTQNAGQQGAGAAGGILSGLGQMIGQSGKQGGQQALAMLKSNPRASQMLAQLAANPLMFLQPPNFT